MLSTPQQNNPSVSLSADSSLCTREPWALPRQLDKLEFDEQVENLYFMQQSKKGVRKNERELVVEN